MAAVIGTLASIGMAVGPPLCYVDQGYSIVRKKDSSGFSHDICGVIIIASIIRVFFWLGRRFETALLVQSLLLIVTMLILLSICLHYAPHHDDPAYSALPLDTGVPRDRDDGSQSLKAEDFEHEAGGDEDVDGQLEMGTYLQPAEREEQPNGVEPRTTTTGSSAIIPPKRIDGSAGDKSWKAFVWGKSGGRPFGFWQWRGFGAYLEFMAGLIIALGVLQVILGRYMWYIDLLGFVSLTIEATLPIPQFMANWRRKSCYGFRSSTLAGWLFGDSFKGDPLQFKLTGLMTICFDIGVLTQRIVYGVDEPRDGKFGSSSRRGSRIPDSEQVVFQMNVDDEGDGDDDGARTRS